MTTYELKDRTVIISDDNFPECYSYRYRTPLSLKGRKKNFLRIFEKSGRFRLTQILTVQANISQPVLMFPFWVTMTYGK